MKANAAHIVKCVNMHDDALKLIKLGVVLFSEIADGMGEVALIEGMQEWLAKAKE